MILTQIHSALLAYRLNASTSDATAPAFALVNGGGIRAAIDEGPITRGKVLTAFPFNNAVVEVTLPGDRLWDVLKGIIEGVNVNNGQAVTSYLQVSRGIKIEYATGATTPTGKALVSVKIGGKPLDRTTEYKLVTIDFLANGGDNFFSPPFSDLVILDTMDEVLLRHIGATSPVNITRDDRLVAVKGCKAKKALRQARAQRKVKAKRASSFEHTSQQL